MSLPEFTDEFLEGGPSSVNQSFEGIDLEPIYRKLDRVLHTVKVSADRTAEKQREQTEELKDLKGTMEILQRQQSETNSLLARIQVRLRNSTFNKEKNKELVRCNKELATALSKRIFHSEFKKRKLLDPKCEEVTNGTLHPSVIPFVYLDDGITSDSD
jgi:predicted  nucleic acid-binding Zn-ribbon protein